MESIEINPPAIKRGRGRPAIISLDPAIKSEILSYVEQGAYMQTAFRAAGVSDGDYYTWQGFAEQGRQQFIDFFEALKRAEALAELTATIKMRDDPKAFVGNATYLERRFRDRWGRSDRHQIDATVSIRVEQVDYTKLAKQVRTHKVK
jgi:hypothetical protein